MTGQTPSIWSVLSIDIAVTAARRAHAQKRCRSDHHPIQLVHRQPYSRWAQFSPHHPIPGTLPRNAMVFVALNLAGPLAAIAVQPTTARPPRARISRWCTLPEHRGHGYGLELLTIAAIASLLTPVDLRLLTADTSLSDRLCQSNAWQLLERRRSHEPGNTAHRTANHTRLPHGTPLFELTPKLLILAS